MTEGQRNHNVYVLAMAFNDFGISKSLASFVCNQYASKDFPQSELKALLVLHTRRLKTLLLSITKTLRLSTILNRESKEEIQKL